MILKINNRKFDFFANVAVSLKYDSVASAFSFDAFFNPDNPDHKDLFKPAAFYRAVVEHNGQKLITGTLLSPVFRDSAKTQTVNITGYSLPGVLEDCEIPTSVYPLQSNGLSLKNIAEKIIKPFGIKLVVDASVSSRVDATYKISKAEHSQTVKSYLSELASQKKVMVTHDADGNLVFTEAKTKQTPLFDFTDGMPGFEYEHSFDGQSCHSEITILGQATAEGANARQGKITNPYCSAFRPRVVQQSSGTDNDSPLAARNILSEELKVVKLKITLDRWELDGKLVMPNNIITVTNPRLYLYKKTNFFIESVDFTGTAESQTCVLNCVLPEVYNNQDPKNIYA